jgi:hypothetical protein
MLADLAFSACGFVLGLGMCRVVERLWPKAWERMSATRRVRS